MSVNINVVVKVRPLLKREKDNQLQTQWRIKGNTIQQTGDHHEQFNFDRIFDENASTNEIFDTVVKPIIDSSLKGINGTIFAYGQTSSGKTYTMLGDEKQPGIMNLAVREIFKEIEKSTDREFLLSISYIEIYNEKVNDLLEKNNDLKLQEDVKGEIQINCARRIVSTEEAVLNVMHLGNRERKIGETSMNERSSRSHAIFRISIESRNVNNLDEENDAVQFSTLNLVDLAGSERSAQSGTTGTRLKEGGFINKSLLSLGLVIQKLSENESHQYINYRDSKLTRMLQASLGGNAMTAIICTVAPAATDETYSTLAFATRAKAIKNVPTVNEEISDSVMLKRLQKEIAVLKKELNKKKSQDERTTLEKTLRQTTEQIITSSKMKSCDKYRRRTWCPSVNRESEIENNNLVEPRLKSPADPQLVTGIESTNDTGIENEEFQPGEDVFKARTPNQFTTKPRHSFSPVPEDLNGKIKELENELEDLQEFTKIEKQLMSPLSSNITLSDYLDLKNELKCAYEKLTKYKDGYYKYLQCEAGLMEIDETKKLSELSRQDNHCLLFNVTKTPDEQSNDLVHDVYNNCAKPVPFLQNIKTPKCLFKRPLQPVSPLHTDWQKCSEELQTELDELEQFTKLENYIPKSPNNNIDDNIKLREELKCAYEELTKLRNEHVELLQLKAGLYDIKEEVEPNEQYNELEARINELNITITQISSERDQLLKDKLISDKQFHKVHKQMETLEIHKNSVEYEFEQYKLKTKVRESELLQLLDNIDENAQSQQNAKLEGLLKESERKNWNLEENIRNMNRENKELTQKLSRYSLETDQNKEENDMRLQHLNAKIEDLESNNNSMKIEIKNLQDERQKIQLEYDELSSQLMDSIQETDDGKEKLRQAQQESKQLIIENSNKDTLINQLKQESLNCHLNIEHLTNQINSLKLNCDEKQSEISSLLLSNDEVKINSNKSIEELNKIVENLREEVINLNVAKTELENNNKELEITCKKNIEEKHECEKLLEKENCLLAETKERFNMLSERLSIFEPFKVKNEILEIEITEAKTLIDKLRLDNENASFDVNRFNEELKLSIEENKKIKEENHLNVTQMEHQLLEKENLLLKLQEEFATNSRLFQIKIEGFAVVLKVRETNFETNISALHQEISNLQSKLTTIEIETEDKNVELANNYSKYNDIEDKYTKLLRNNEELQNEINQINIERDEFEKLLNEIVTEQEDLFEKDVFESSKYKNNIKKMNILIDKVNSLQNNLKEEKDKFSSIEQQGQMQLKELNNEEIKRFKSNEQTFESKIEELHKEIGILSNEKLDLESKLLDLTNKNTKYLSKISEHTAKEDNFILNEQHLQTKLNEFTQDKCHLQKQIVILQMERENLSVIVENNRSVLREAEDECNTMRLLLSTFQKVQEENNFLKTENKDLKDDLQKLEDQIELNESSVHYKTVNTTLSEEIKKIKLTVREQEVELKETAENLNETSVRMRDCEHEISTLMAEKGDLLKNQTDLIDERNKLNATLRSMQKRCLELETKIEDSQNQNMILKDENKSLKDEYNKKQKELDGKSELFNETKRDLELQIEKYCFLNSEYTKVQNTLIDLEKSYNELNQNVNKKIEKLENQIGVLEENKAILGSKVTQLNEKMKKLRNECSNHQLELETTKKKLRANVNLFNDVQRYLNEKDALKHSLNCLKDELKAKKDQNNELLTNNDFLQKCNKSFQEKINEITVALNEAKAQSDNIKKLRYIEENLLKEIEENEEKYNTNINQMKFKLRKSFEQIKQLEQTIHDLQTKARTEQSFTEKEEKIRSLEQELQKVRSEKDELRKSVEKNRKFRRQSVHDEGRLSMLNDYSWLGTCDVGLQTDPTNRECSCEEMDTKLKELNKESKLKTFQINTLKLELKNHPLCSENKKLQKVIAQAEQDNYRLRKEINKLNCQLQQSFSVQDCLNCFNIKNKRVIDKGCQTQSTINSNSEGSGLITENENIILKRSLNKMEQKYNTMKKLCIIRGEVKEAKKQNLNDQVNPILIDTKNVIRKEIVKLVTEDKSSIIPEASALVDNFEIKSTDQVLAENTGNLNSSFNEIDHLRKIIDEMEEELKQAENKYEKIKRLFITCKDRNQYLENEMKKFNNN